MKIRKFKKEDAEEVCNIIRRCDKEIASRDYSKKIIDWWDKKITLNYILDKSENRFCLVAIFENNVVGYISLDDNEIKKLHINPDYHGRGIGKKLIKRVEDFSINNNNNNNLVVESTIYAKKFYEKCGFRKVKINYCEHDNEKFKLIFMEKKLK